MKKPQIKSPNRPRPSLVEAYNGYYGNLKQFYAIVVRFWESCSPSYIDASILCATFAEHISPTESNGFLNEFHIRSIDECYKYSAVWYEIEFYIRNWKYCEYYIGSDLVYHNELDCYIRNITKNIVYPNIKIIDPVVELKKRREKWIHEKHLFDIVKQLYGNYVVSFHYRAKWLEHLELDIFIEDLKMGIEYQGIQHYQVVEHWGGIDGLRQRQLNDTKKKMLCERYGVTLIYFDYTEPITNAYVKHKLTTILRKK